MRSDEAADYLTNGLRVRSRIPLRLPELAASEAEAEVTIDWGRVAAPELPPGREADFFAGPGDLILVVREVGRFRAMGGRRVVVDPEPDAREEDIRLYVSGSVLGAIWLQRGLLPLHASSVAVPGGGCVGFIGQSGAGKSSLAAHFSRSGYALVADDVSVLLEREEVFGVWPGPARVKLAADALASLDREAGALPHTGGTREKYHLEVGDLAAGAAEPVPLRRVFLLSYGEGAPRTVPLTGLDAIDAIGGHTYRQEFVRPLGLEKEWLRQVAAVARNVPVMRLIRPRGYDRTGEVIEAVLAATDGRNAGEVQA